MDTPAFATPQTVEQFDNCDKADNPEPLGFAFDTEFVQKTQLQQFQEQREYFVKEVEKLDKLINFLQNDTDFCNKLDEFKNLAHG